MESDRKEKLFKSLCQMIVSDAKRRKEKVIAIDMETFQEKKGKIVKLKIMSGVIEEMERYLKED